MRERRVVRSRNTTEALSHLLAARAKHRGSEALVVGTEDGLVVAAPQTFEQSELTAAFGATRASGKSVPGATKLSAHALLVDGMKLILTAVGGPPLKQGELNEDMARILRTA